MTTAPRTKTVAGTITRQSSAAPDEDEVTITTPVLDLMRDHVVTTGMDIARYMSGPRAVNLAHWETPLPVGQTVALTKTPAGIRARFRWLEHAGAQAVRSVFAEGVLGASIEFRADEAVPNDSGGWDFTKTTLTGWALTGNPANLSCVKMYQALGWSAEREFRLNLEEDDAPVLLVDTDESISLDVTRLVPERRPEMVTVDGRHLRAAFTEVIASEARRQIRLLRGRVD